LCLKQHANIWLIRAMNRPAIFRIIGGDKAPHYGVIRFISHGHAIIQLDQQQWRVSLSELKHHIQGKITLIWSSPPGFQKDIQQGGSGKAVAWLITQLDRIQGTMIPPRHVEEMDDLLVARLKDFQSSQGLPADGIAGVRTLMRINEQIGLAIPRLLQLAKR
jgi:general secretion pathway protein A